MTVDKKTGIKGSEFGGGGFFASMGISKPTDKTQDKNAEAKAEAKKEDISKDDLVNAITSNPVNAKVIRRHEDKPQRKKAPAPTRKRPTANKTAAPQKENISFSQNTRKPQAKKPTSETTTATTTTTGTKKPATRTATTATGTRRPATGTRTRKRAVRKPTTRPAGSKSPTRRRPTRGSSRPKAAPTPAAPKKIKKAMVSDNLKKKNHITIGSMITIKEFSEKTGVALPDIMTIMMQNGIMGGLMSNIDFDTAQLIGEEVGVKVEKEDDTVSVESIIEGDLKAILDLDKDNENNQERPPIVTIMGHVDHGKTTLLDYLRKTKDADGEAGGITQTIGASSILHNDKKITFIDTPGHALFSTMRARGAKLTDIVVIIIAADDGIMPQTVESINHAKEAGVPIIVAITKIDKPGANKQEDIKKNIGNYGLIPEAWGGDVPVIEVSGKTGIGMDSLLEHISLQAEVLELTYNEKRAAVGVVLDAKKSAKQGIETTLIVMTGTLKVGDILAVHNTYGKVKRMVDWTGKAIKQATGGQPVQILGINDAPQAGRIAECVKSEKEAAQKIALIMENERNESNTNSLQALMMQMKEGEKTQLKLILKADGPTSLEALEFAVENVPCPKNVTIKKVHTDIGQFTESDLALSQASGALMIGFGIKTNASIFKKAEQQKSTLKTYNIIYQITDFLEEVAQGMLEIKTEEYTAGKLEVLGVFFHKGKDMVIGGRILNGIANPEDKFRVIRNDEIIGTGTVESIQKNQDTVKEVNEGTECGFKVKTQKKIEIGDTIEFIKEREIQEDEEDITPTDLPQPSEKKKR